MQIEAKKSNKFIAISTLFLLSLLLTKLTYIYFTYKESDYVQIIPDDAFYYLKIAKNFVLNGIWTFDGENLASGFHPLHAYFISLIFKLNQKIELKNIFLIFSSIYIVSYTFSYFQIMRVLDSNLNKKSSLIFGFIPWISTASLSLPFMLMEGWIPLICTSSFFYFLNIKSKDKATSCLIFLCGTIGILGRLDFFILSFAILLSFILFRFKSSNNLLILSKIKFFFFGNLTGIAILLIHNFYNFRRFLSSSAEIKSHWVSIEGYDFKSIMTFIPKVFLPTEFNSIAAYCLLILFCGISSVIFFKLLKKSIINSNKFIIFSTSYIFIILCIFAFTKSGGNAYWYLVPFIIPSTFLTSYSIDELIRKPKFFFNYILIFFLITLSSSNLFFRYYPLQEEIYRKSLDLSETNFRKVGSWNSGIVSYFSNNIKVINLDGLVNDSIIKYIKNNNVNDYIKIERLDALVDYESTLREVHQGINYNQIKECIDNKELLEKKEFSIFKIKDNCL